MPKWNKLKKSKKPGSIVLRGQESARSGTSTPGRWPSRLRNLNDLVTVRVVRTSVVAVANAVAITVAIYAIPQSNPTPPGRPPAKHLNSSIFVVVPCIPRMKKATSTPNFGTARNANPFARRISSATALTTRSNSASGATVAGSGASTNNIVNDYEGKMGAV